MRGWALNVEVCICISSNEDCTKRKVARGGLTVDYRCANRRFWLSSYNCQVPTPTTQNQELEQQIRIFGAD
jgi:hypothetical protein